MESRFILILDVQGAEVAVIRGGLITLQNTDFVFCEVSLASLYKGLRCYKSLVKSLQEKGFKVVSTMSK
jgi:hypothetical protein